MGSVYIRVHPWPLTKVAENPFTTVMLLFINHLSLFSSQAHSTLWMEESNGLKTTCSIGESQRSTRPFERESVLGRTYLVDFSGKF